MPDTYDELFLANAKLRADLDEAREALRKAYSDLDRDRTGLAKALDDIRTEIRGRSWTTEGRGSYEWNDDRYRDEAHQAFAAVLTIVEKGLHASGAIADSGCKAMNALFTRDAILAAQPAAGTTCPFCHHDSHERTCGCGCRWMPTEGTTAPGMHWYGGQGTEQPAAASAEPLEMRVRADDEADSLIIETRPLRSEPATDPTDVLPGRHPVPPKEK